MTLINEIEQLLQTSGLWKRGFLESLTDDDRETYNRIKSNACHLDPWIMAIETFKNRISLI